MTSPDWSLYRAFAAVLRFGSLTAAARALNLSQPTLGRRIAALEDRLGVALFTRSPEGLSPTPEAQAMRPRLEALEAAAEALDRGVGADAAEAASVVRLSASEVVAAEVLPAAVGRLQDDDPGLTVEVVVSNAAQDVLRREVDIAVRMTRPRQDGLVVRKVRDIELGLFAHPRCFEARPPPDDAAGLAGLPMVGFDTPRDYTRLFQIEGQAVGREAFRFRSDSDMAQLGAVRAGLGVGVCHVPLATGLVRVLPQLFAPRIELWLAMHADLLRTPRFRRVFRGLAGAL